MRETAGHEHDSLVVKSGSMLDAFRHKSALALKRMIYGRKGEPYRVQGHALRFVPGTRPIRLKYARSTNDVSRYEALQVELFSTQLGEGDVAIDIGAHAGEFSLIMAVMCGRSGRVVAFEPDPYARKVLMHNIGLNPQIKAPLVEELAVSDGDGETWLYSRGGDSCSSLARSGIAPGPDPRIEKIRVKLVSLDGYLSANGIVEPRWIKIDAEGAEIRILHGAKAVLSGRSNILCELHPYAWPEFGNTFAELRTLCQSAGRRIRYLDATTELRDRPKYGAVLLERQRV